MNEGLDSTASLEGMDLDHELDDYINDWALEFDSPHPILSLIPPGLSESSSLTIEQSKCSSNSHSSQFFNEAFYLDLPGSTDVCVPDASDDFECNYEVPDCLIDPQLRGASSNPSQYDILQTSTPPMPAQPPIRSPPKRVIPPTTTCWFGRKLLRKSKKDESTYDHSPESKSPILDRRLYEHVKRDSVPFKLPPQATPGLQSAALSAPLITPCSPSISAKNPRESRSSGSIEISQEYIDSFLSSVSADMLEDATMLDFVEYGVPDAPSTPSTSTSEQRFQVIDKNEFTWRMLAPSAPPVQPSEKRKRGRPKKDEVEESHQEAASYIPKVPFHAPAEAVNTIRQSPERRPQAIATPPAPLSYPAPTPTSTTYATPEPSPEVFSRSQNEGEPASKRRRVTINGAYRSMSKKEQAYLEMDKKVKLYDETNIHDLLYFPTVRPGRTPCFWIQRHPYANTKIYDDHYRTWCRYRHCKGVETHELIRTATGEMREKNYKHPRTIIAGNYQVAVDWEYVDDEIGTFKNDPDGQYEYDKRNIYDNIECFFHLRCFELLTNFPQVVRQHLVKVDHRVLNKDKSRNKITKRKNKGGTNAAEIEWYLKDEAERWMQRVRDDWRFNPLPGSDESLERRLLTGKKTYNEKKGTSKLRSGQSPTQSPGP
ncbi:hypothetical protein TWF696_004907 [Orbilia brochopaga]|uniref:Uncharacterized protein n=1 Tax=Orbilia brochopaga TaxID=3140254 RepID=A0AAV9V268_9PEZI